MKSKKNSFSSCLRKKIQEKLNSLWEEIEFEEVKKIEAISMSEAKILDGIELMDLSVFGMRSSDVVDTSGFEGLSSLWHFEAWFSSLGDISALASCKALTKVDLDCCLVEDISPLLELPKLRWLNLNGNPLNPESYYNTLPILEESTLRNRFGIEAEKPIHNAESDWKLGREMWERGIRAVYYRNDDIPRLAFPGLSITQQPELDRYDLAPEVLRSILDSGELDTKALYEKLKDMPYQERIGQK